MNTRDRARLLLLLGLLVAWLLRWTTAQTVFGAEIQHGAERTGAVAALTLLALWGLAVTAAAARRRPAASFGVALNDAVVSAAAAVLLVAEHPWLPGGAARASWIPVFAPLAVLALLHAVLLARRLPVAREVELIRSGAAWLAAVALAAGGAFFPAAVGLWLGLSPLLVGRVTRWGAGLEGLLLIASVAALLAPDLHDAAFPGGATEGLYLGHYVWIVLSVTLVLLAIAGLWRALAEPTAADCATASSP